MLPHTTLSCLNLTSTSKSSRPILNSFIFQGMNVSFMVLNTNVYYYNKESMNGTDPCGQLAWMNSTLSALEKDQKVFLAVQFSIFPQDGLSRSFGEDVNYYNKASMNCEDTFGQPALHG